MSDTQAHSVRCTSKDLEFSSFVAPDKTAFAEMNALQWNLEETVIPLATRLFTASL